MNNFLQANLASIRNCGVNRHYHELPGHQCILCATICLLGSYHICRCWSSWR